MPVSSNALAPAPVSDHQKAVKKPPTPKAKRKSRCVIPVTLAPTDISVPLPSPRSSNASSPRRSETTPATNKATTINTSNGAQGALLHPTANDPPPQQPRLLQPLPTPDCSGPPPPQLYIQDPLRQPSPPTQRNLCALAPNQLPPQYYPSQSAIPSQVHTSQTIQNQGPQPHGSQHGESQSHAHWSQEPHRKRLCTDVLPTLNQSPLHNSLLWLDQSVLAANPITRRLFLALRAACLYHDGLFLLFHQAYWMWCSGDSARQSIVYQKLQCIPGHVLAQFFAYFSGNAIFHEHLGAIIQFCYLPILCTFPYTAGLNAPGEIITQLRTFMIKINMGSPHQLEVRRRYPVTAFDLMENFSCDSVQLCAEVFKRSCMQLGLPVMGNDLAHLLTLFQREIKTEKAIRSGQASQNFRDVAIWETTQYVDDMRNPDGQRSTSTNSAQQVPPESHCHLNPPSHSVASFQGPTAQELTAQELLTQKFDSKAKPTSNSGHSSLLPSKEQLETSDKEPVLYDEPPIAPLDSQHPDPGLSSEQSPSVSTPSQSRQVVTQCSAQEVPPVQHQTELPQLQAPNDREYRFINQFILEPKCLSPAPGIQSIFFDLEKADLESPSVHFRLRICRFAPGQLPRERQWAAASVHWPRTIYVRLNQQTQYLRRWEMHDRDFPLEVSDCLKEGENHLEISFPVKSGKVKNEDVLGYYIAVESMVTETHDKTMNMINASPRINRQETIDNIDQVITSSEDQGSLNKSTTVKMIDPISRRLISIPVRGVDCQHLGCFDLRAHLRKYIWLSDAQGHKVDEWLCPICQSDARPQSLRIDDFFTSVRRCLAEFGIGDVSAIVISSGGSWYPLDGGGMPMKKPQAQQAIEID